MTTKIEWTDETWNPVTGCTPISPGCANCYAKRMARRLAGRCGYPEAPNHFDVTQRDDRLRHPLKWKKPRRVFVCSMSDLFHDEVEWSFIGDVFDIMMDTPQHTYQLLTKRPERALDFIMDFWLASIYGKTLPNVWLGVTAENQEQADKRIPILLQIPAAVRFVSVEPMLGKIDFDYDSDVCHCGIPSRDHTFENHTFVSMTSSYLIDCLDWVICGAETGPRKRPMQLDWARSLRDQCKAAGVPFFFKKDSQGNHELDGVIHEEFPR